MQYRRILLAAALFAAVSSANAEPIISAESLHEAVQLWLDGTLAKRNDHETLSTDDMVDVFALTDLDGDGREDAVLSLSNGGTCCEPELTIVSGTADHLVLLPVASDGEEVKVIEDGATRLLQVKDLQSTRLLRFDGERLITVRTTSQLKALVEIEGVGGFYEGSDLARSLTYNGLDGRQAQIACEINTRWGTLDCDLPLPDGTVQPFTQSCQRFGALASQRNGYREFVCDNDTRLGFDGAKWSVLQETQD